MKNIITMENNEIICCAKEKLPADSDLDYYDAEDEHLSQVDSKVFGYIIKQKDILIKELYDKINILNKQIELLQEVLKSSILSVNGDKKELECSEEKPAISSISDKQTNSKADKYKGNSQTTIKKYQLVYWRHKQNKTKHVIVGKNTNASNSLQGVPKQVDLHVYRIAPNTEAEALAKFLRASFPDVSCEALVPKYPDLYSSFKVRIYEKNLQEAMDPLLWPENACVRPFLYRRSKYKINLPQVV
ncbi:uncharacterized protein [Leptinotarsa decemlineata]|uniref:uncharacterized protein n=1 Tax=Leptinotarsa decemlineata TaxID=7539 RepID=UPI003D307DD1